MYHSSNQNTLTIIRPLISKCPQAQPLLFCLLLFITGACQAPKTGGEKVLIYAEDFLNQLNQTYRQQNKKKLNELYYALDSLPPTASQLHQHSQNLDQWIDSLRNRIIQVYSLNRMSRSWLHENSLTPQNPIHQLSQKLLAFQALSQELAQTAEDEFLKPIRFDTMINPLWSDSLRNLPELIHFNFSTPQRTLLIATLTGLSFQVLKWEHRYLQVLENKSRAFLPKLAANFQVKLVLDTNRRQDSIKARVFLSPPERLVQLSTYSHTLQNQEIPFSKRWAPQIISSEQGEIRLEAGLCYRFRSNVADSCWQTHKIYTLDTLLQPD